MGRWNYRVIKRKHEESKTVSYQIHEVYYKKNGKIKGWTKNPVSVHGEDINELFGDFSNYKKAIFQPTLEERKTKKGKLKLVPVHRVKKIRKLYKKLKLVNDENSLMTMMTPHAKEDWNSFFNSLSHIVTDHFMVTRDDLFDKEVKSFPEQNLIGQFRQFKNSGQIYKIISPIKEFKDGDWLLQVKVVETGKEIEYRYEKIKNDPEPQ